MSRCLHTAKERRGIPSQDELLRRYNYDPETGILTHKLSVSGNVRAGDQTGQNGAVYIDSIKYKTSRVIWKLVTGDEPPLIVDHEDGNHQNNRWSNLRAADYAKNKQNTVHNKARSATGVRGVIHNRRKPGTFVAQIGAGENYRWLGVFTDLEAARQARIAAEVERYGEFRTDRSI